MINDVEMMSAFWGLVEQLLNTLLFTLGGLVFGDVISNHGERKGFWTANEWGYLLLLWVLLHVIRYVMVYMFYPVTKRIGLSTNWQEAFFLSYGGLRGAVGISLAIAIDNSVWSVTKDETFRRFTTQLFGMVGGTAFLTLVINGSTAGPLLRKLGLAKSTDTRKKVLQIFKKDYRVKKIDDLISLLADELFARVEFAHVLHHLDLTEAEVLNRYNEKVADKSARNENDLDSVISRLRGTGVDAATEVDVEKPEESRVVHEIDAPGIGADYEQDHESVEVDTNILQELRTTFIDQLKWAYHKQLLNGGLDGRQAFLLYVLWQGLEFAADDVTRGEPVKDWTTSQLVSRKPMDRAESWIKKPILLMDSYARNNLVMSA